MNSIKFKRLFIVLAVLMCLFSMSTSVLADVGNTHSGGYPSSSSSSSSDDSGLIRAIFFILVYIPFPLNLIIVLAIIAVVYWQRKKGNTDYGKTIKTQAAPSPSMTIPATAEPIDVKLVKIYETDPDFSLVAFKTFAKDVFIKVQEAWEERKWEVVRPFESNELFETHAKQLAEFVKDAQFPHLDRQEIHNIAVCKWSIEGNFEFLEVYLRASLLDFVTDAEGVVVSGSKTTRQMRKYRLIFKRVKGVQTLAEKDATTNCPNCGAPTAITSSGQCTYCKSVITTGNYGWVLDGYQAWE